MTYITLASLVNGLDTDSLDGNGSVNVKPFQGGRLQF